MSIARRFGVFVFALSLLFGGGSVAAAAAETSTATAKIVGTEPAVNYPVNEVLRKADDKCGRHALLRRGYYNGNRGFGFDKMFHKHNLKHTGVFVFVLGNPNCGVAQGGSTRKYDAYANRVQCNIGGCEVTDIRRIYMPVDYRNEPGIPGQKGVITGYCYEAGEERCPDWVDQSINLRTIADERTIMSYAPLDSQRQYTHAELDSLSAPSPEMG